MSRPRNFTGDDADVWRKLSPSEWAIIEGMEAEDRRLESSLRRKREARRLMEENEKRMAPCYSKWAKYRVEKARKSKSKRMRGAA